MKIKKFLLVFGLVAGGIGGGVAGQEIRGEDAAAQARKRIEIARSDLEPVLDGILDDAIWREATLITDLHQFQPVDQGVPTEQSEFYIAYNERFFFVGARLYDSDPAGISARQLVQGQGMGFDDAIEFILDTFNNGRGGYHFQVNPNGIRRDGVFENPSSLNRDWEGIWQVEARIDELGWTAEVAIPFNTLNFDPESDTWGFTIARTVARKKEEMAWSSFNRNLNPTTTGLITGLRDMRQGLGLDIIPSMAMARADNEITGLSEERIDPSLNVFYKITPNLTGALTLNTDFSATEADNRQVNLSRFSLFFPERRDFFLQDVDIFSFGGLWENGIPFYSRRIGLSATGSPVDIDVGTKLTGRVGRWNVGALAVQQGDSPTLDGQDVFVGRAAVNVLSESSWGVILTEGDPNSERDNSVIGTDFRYQNTRFTDTHTLRGNAWVQRSETEGLDGDDKAFGAYASLGTSNTGVGGEISYEYFGEHFNPALGFANRTGVDSLFISSNGRYFFDNHALIRNYFSFIEYKLVRDLETKEMQSENFFYRFFHLNSHLGDQFNLSVGRNREGLSEDFQIRPGIVIPAGKYAFARWNMEINGSDQRLLAPYFRYGEGEFYNGDRTQITGGFNWRPNAHMALSLDYQYQDIEMPEGDFDVRLVRLNANFAFNSKWSWLNLLQYDNGSRTVGLNSRLRWNPQAGEDFFLVLNHNFNAEGVFARMGTNASEVAMKYTKTFRF